MVMDSEVESVLDPLPSPETDTELDEVELADAVPPPEEEE
jgi:hypothetical protein